MRTGRISLASWSGSASRLDRPTATVGPTLRVTEGVVLVSNRDGTTIRIRAGDTVWTPPGEEHWHGGTADNLMCHLAMLEGTDDGDGTTWLGAVTDDQYRAANQQ